MHEIKEIIQELAADGLSFIIGDRAKVTEVNDDRTCRVELLKTGQQVEDVRLQAIPSLSEGFYIKPKIGSNVVIMWMDEKSPVIVLTGEVESMELLGSSLGGLIKKQELTTQLNKVTSRIDGIIDAINNGIAVAQDGGENLQTTIKAALATITDIEDFSNIENSKITHG